MTPGAITVHVPATSANLGPGFDCLGMALDLWNTATFTLQTGSRRVVNDGEGKESLPEDDQNLIFQAMDAFTRSYGIDLHGVHVTCQNKIPVSSGLGSSAAAIVAGLLGANALAGNPAGRDDLLRLAIGMEGHPDNVSACLLGGLVVVVMDGEEPVYRRFELPPLTVGVVLPDVRLTTHAARMALPAQVSNADAAFSLGRTVLVVEALRQGDLDLLARAMDDRLHQPYRLRLIPGAGRVIRAGLEAGARAIALSGAGPSLIAFPYAPVILEHMVDVFSDNGIGARSLALAATNAGASAQIQEGLGRA